MNEKIKEMLVQLLEVDREAVELIELAYAYGQCGEPILEQLIEQRLVTLVTLHMENQNPTNDRSNYCCQNCDDDDDDEIEFSCDLDDNDNDWDDLEEDEEEIDEEEDEELLALNAKLGLDILNTRPIVLAGAIIRITNNDLNQQDILINQVTKYGYSKTHLQSLVENL